MVFFSEAKGGGGLPSPSISKRRRDGNSSRSSRSASLKLAALLALVSFCSFMLGRTTLPSTSTATPSSSSVPPHGPSGSPEQFPLTVVTLSIRPRVFFLPGFADPELASALADATEPKLVPSTLALRPGEKAEDKAGIRTSDGVFVSAAEDASGFLAAVERKAEALIQDQSDGLLHCRDGRKTRANLEQHRLGFCRVKVRRAVGDRLIGRSGRAEF